MSVIVDLILLLASGVATIYCFVLSRRLSRLNDTKNGIGASIASMTHALDQTQQVMAIARNSSLVSIQELTTILEEAERIRPEIKALLEQIGHLAEISVEDIELARSDAIRLIDRSAKKAVDMHGEGHELNRIDQQVSVAKRAA